MGWLFIIKAIPGANIDKLMSAEEHEKGFARSKSRGWLERLFTCCVDYELFLVSSLCTFLSISLQTLTYANMRIRPYTSRYLNQ